MASPAPLRLRAAQVRPGTTVLKTSSAIGVGAPRQLVPGGAARDASLTAETVNADEVVRVELENGLVLWMRADDLLRERGVQAPSRSGAPAAWDIDTAPRANAFGDPPAGSSRGLLKIGIKLLEFFGVDLKGQAAAAIGKTFEERKLGRAPGLWRVDLGDSAAFSAISDPAAKLPATQPLLLFLHGTASSCMGSFGKLWTTTGGEDGSVARNTRAALAARYGSQVLAFEHRSLTESPIENALALVKQLPSGAQLDIVSHSRGGLIGELLCLRQRERTLDPLAGGVLDELFTTDRTVAQQIGLGSLVGEQARLRNEAYAADAARLKELLALLDKKAISVRRFVRVACPARGTTLASGRLDRWLSVLDLLTGGGIIGDIADFMLAIVKERTDPRSLPGLEAMMPGSAVTRLLHLPGLVTGADLSVIAGDIEGTGIWGQLKLLAADWFYGGDHDLVVNTGSMYGGLRRPDGGGRFLRDQGEQVTHFNYFGHRKSIAWMLAGLQRDEASDGGFLPIDFAPVEEPRWRGAVARSQDPAATPRPIVLLVPGTMGSALNARGQRVWLHYTRLLQGGLEDIGMGQPDVQAVEVLGDFYGPLLEHLARTHRVEVHAYDWRLSVRDAAVGLATRIDQLVADAERTRQPLHIVAHSMGGLVVRSAIGDGALGAQAWRRMSALPGSRLLMLGTPNFGSHEAVRWLTGFNPTQAKLILLDFKHGANGIIDIVRRYPGLVELLPFTDGRFADSALWQNLKKQLGAGFPLVDEATLRAAAGTWNFMRNAPVDPALMVYVAGQARSTVVDYEIVDTEPSGRKLQWIGTAQGDGTVAWASGRLPGVPTWYAPDTAHDELCANTADSRVFRGYVELLMQGKTDQLPAAPPSTARGAAADDARFVVPDLPVTDDLPDEAALRGAGFGGGRRRALARPAASGAVIAISVTHGDLAYARHPVLVGHYVGDTIVSAERALDRRLQGALSRRHELGLYPGPVGTHAVFFNEKAGGKPAGAVVVGLGQVGSLSGGKLETGVRDALLEHAIAAAQRERECGTGAPFRARYSCLLVGTGANHLSARDAIEAMLRAALAANRRLEEARLDGQVLIDQLEFIELYEDVAIGAARDLGAIARSREFDGRLRIEGPGLAQGPGHRRRGSFASDASWDQRLEITLADQRLRFVFTGDRARAEESLASGQLSLAEGFIREANTSTSRNAEVARTLFEMLLPVGLRESTFEDRGLVLLLDAESARFPWELLEDRWSRSGRPPAVAGGMVRQFKTADYRERPAYASGPEAFVVGNPDLSSDPDFPDLPGARKEAENVRDLLRQQGFKVRASIDETPGAILAGLHSGAWRVMHLAGHGEHDFPDPQGGPPRSGMVIGKGVFLTPGDVNQMRHVPELVFINCCHLGKTQRQRAPDFNRLAANLGAQFIDMGVRAVVCAGWAVDDAAALTFARVFYAELFGGARFADAVRRARSAVFDGHPGVNTWGAYQCYGDPAFRLYRNDGSTSSGPGAPFVAPSELVVELANLAEWTRVQLQESDEAAQAERLRRAVEALLQRVPAGLAGTSQDWLARADVAAGLGFAFGEAKLFADAVSWFEKALGAQHGDCPVSAAEQCANFKVRLAGTAWQALLTRDAPADERLAEQRRLITAIEAAVAELDVINQRASTPERLALLGSACKRLANIHDAGRQRLEALMNMAQYYRQRWDRLQQDDAYALTNWGTACLLVRALDPELARGDWLPALGALCVAQAERDAARERGADKPDLWRALGLGDIELLQLLLAANDAAACAQRAAATRQCYASALARGASPRAVASVTENLDFLLAQTSDWPAPVRAALAALRAAF